MREQSPRCSRHGSPTSVSTAVVLHDAFALASRAQVSGIVKLALLFLAYMFLLLIYTATLKLCKFALQAYPPNHHRSSPSSCYAPPLNIPVADAISWQTFSSA